MYQKLKRRIDRWRFKASVRRLRHKKLCIIANNCLGSRFYKIIKREYNTPFVGLFLLPECFVKLSNNFEYYMSQEVRFVTESKYAYINQLRENHEGDYPLGLLVDLEINFLHYRSQEEALDKWDRRKKRMDWEHLYFVLIANGPCDDAMMRDFVKDRSLPKVCFHRREDFKLPGCVYIPSATERMGNLYSQYQRFVGRFDFADWIIKAQRD